MMSSSYRWQPKVKFVPLPPRDRKEFLWSPRAKNSNLEQIMVSIPQTRHQHLQRMTIYKTCPVKDSKRVFKRIYNSILLTPLTRSKIAISNLLMIATQFEPIKSKKIRMLKMLKIKLAPISQLSRQKPHNMNKNHLRPLKSLLNTTQSRILFPRAISQIT